MFNILTNLMHFTQFVCNKTAKAIDATFKKTALNCIKPWQWALYIISQLQNYFHLYRDLHFKNHHVFTIFISLEIEETY